MAKVTVTYLLSKEGQKASLLTGGDGKRIQKVEAVLDHTDPLLKRILALQNTRILEDGSLSLGIGLNKYGVHAPTLDIPDDIEPLEYEPGYRYAYREIKADFDTIPSLEELLTFQETVEEEIATNEKRLEPAKAKYVENYKKLQAERAAREAELIKAQELRQKQLMEQKEKRRQEMLQWIEQNGSEYLRKCIRLGYKCNREYVRERASIEYPQFVPDFASAVEYHEKTAPSTNALELLEELLAKGINAKIVWVSDIERDSDPYFDLPTPPFEAIMIPEYLDYANLYLPV